MNLKNVLVWAATIFLALIFIPGGLGKLTAIDVWQERFVEQWGVPGWMVPITAVMEVFGGLLVLAPGLAKYGGGLIVFVMLGASGSHAMAGEWPNAGFTLFLLLLAALVANTRRLQPIADNG